MKNLYAYNSFEELVHIDEVDKTLQQNYYCCNCKEIMIPRKGKINAHHYSHKSATCSYESYIHKLAKIKFADEYKKSLTEKLPFLLEYNVKRTCNTCLNYNDFGISCTLNSKTKLFDLTTVFDKISIEKKHSGFVADIILESSKRSDKIFIEFAVTHKCTDEKLKSGVRIIEFDIFSEQDVLDFAKRKISSKSNNVRFHNFVQKNFVGKIRKNFDCKIPFHFFRVFKNNSARLSFSQMREIIQDMTDGELLYYDVIDEEYSINEEAKFIQIVKEISNIGIPVKNCHACRFLVRNGRRRQTNPYFCKLHRTEIEDTNEICRRFWRI